MFELNKKVAPQENLVGWFATGTAIAWLSNRLCPIFIDPTDMKI